MLHEFFYLIRLKWILFHGKCWCEISVQATVNVLINLVLNKLEQLNENGHNKVPVSNVVGLVCTHKKPSRSWTSCLHYVVPGDPSVLRFGHCKFKRKTAFTKHLIAELSVTLNILQISGTAQAGEYIYYGSKSSKNRRMIYSDHCLMTTANMSWELNCLVTSKRCQGFSVLESVQNKRIFICLAASQLVLMSLFHMKSAWQSGFPDASSAMCFLLCYELSERYPSMCLQHNFCGWPFLLEDKTSE